MALYGVSTNNGVVIINGREITDWGVTDPPFNVEYIDALSSVVRGHGGNAYSSDRINPGIRVTLNIIPGSPDAVYLAALANTRTEISGTYTSLSAGELALWAEGKFVNSRALGRMGANANDSTFVAECNKGVIN